MGNIDAVAAMTMDLKRSRFRIHKETLHSLGNPKYIQFLINPEEMYIAILGSDRPLAGGTANKINVVKMKEGPSIEFYSHALLYGVVNMIGSIDFRYSYRLSGEIDTSNRVAYFSLHTMRRIERRPTRNGEGI